MFPRDEPVEHREPKVHLGLIPGVYRSAQTMTNKIIIKRRSETRKFENIEERIEPIDFLFPAPFGSRVELRRSELDELPCEDGRLSLEPCAQTSVEPLAISSEVDRSCDGEQRNRETGGDAETIGIAEGDGLWFH